MSDCVEWDGEKTWMGFAIQSINGEPQRLVHRLVYMEKYGYTTKPIEHSCFNYSCVNVDHLREAEWPTLEQIMKGKDD